MSRSAQTPGRSSLRTPSRSIRCPPVILIIGISYLSATSAIRRSCSALVTPPVICGHHRERAVPLDVGVHPVVDEPGIALVDVLVVPQHLEQRRQRHLRRRRPPRPARARRTPPTPTCSPRSRHAAISVGLSIGIDGTYQPALSSTSTSPPVAQSTMSQTRPLHDPQPLPALVAAMTPLTLLVPFRTHATRSPFETPLQLQTCTESSISAAPCSPEGPASSKSSSTRSSGSGRPRSKLWVRNATFPTSPSRVAPTSLPSRITTDL